MKNYENLWKMKLWKENWKMYEKGNLKKETWKEKFEKEKKVEGTKVKWMKVEWICGNHTQINHL